MLEEHLGQCPYCWEHIYFEIDLSIENQEYVEDCQVCCNPILLRVNSIGLEVHIETAREDDGF